MMNVNTMRTIDKWVGMPLCFCFSMVNWIVNAISPARRQHPNVSNTLFIELSEMGSAVIADPAMRKIQREGNATLFFVIFEDNYKSLEILKTIPAGNIFKMQTADLVQLTVSFFRFAVWCRYKKITCVIDLELFSRFTALLSLFSGARYRVGFASFHDEGLYRGNLINYPVRYNPHVHVAVNFVSLVNRALGTFDNPYATIPLKADDLDLAKATISEEQLNTVRTKIKNLYTKWEQERIILFNVNASDMLPQRRWQPENFATVAKRLLDEFKDILIIATGAPAEREYVQGFVDAVNDPRCINSSGVFRFDELVPLYYLSSFMLTNDSGPAHFAAVTSLKVFVLFGPETPALYLPLGGNAEPFYLALPCSPCVSAANHRKTTCLTRPCISTMQPEWITSRLRQYLHQLQVA